MLQDTSDSFNPSQGRPDDSDVSLGDGLGLFEQLLREQLVETKTYNQQEMSECVESLTPFILENANLFMTEDVYKLKEDNDYSKEYMDPQLLWHKHPLQQENEAEYDNLPVDEDRPSKSFTQMAEEAVMGHPLQRVYLSDIYAWIESKYPYFKCKNGYNWRVMM